MTADTLAILRANVSYVDAIAALETRSFDPVDRFSKKTWRYLLSVANKRGTAITLIAKENNVIVGSINVLIRSKGHTARIYSIAVDPAMRGRGIGAMLIRALDQHLNKQYDRLSLEVRSDNKVARGLYERLGFRLDRPLPRYYPDGGDGVRYCRARAGVS